MILPLRREQVAGATSPDLASRLSRLDKQIGAEQRDELATLAGGRDLKAQNAECEVNRDRHIVARSDQMK